MFGLFKKREPNSALDAVIMQIYGSLDHKKTADLEIATDRAFELLLSRTIDRNVVHAKASELFRGPMPYSTNDLAVSVAMIFYKDDQYKALLMPVQLMARVTLLEWINEGSVAKPLAMVFENTLYDRFKGK